MEERASGQNAFLWMDASPDLARRVREGEVLVAPGASHNPRKVPHGLIHHWVGAVFLSSVTLDEVMRVLDNYDHYSDFYRPIVLKSKLLERTDGYAKVNLLMVQKALGVTAAVETDNEIHIRKLDANRVYSLSNSVRVQEIADYGQPGERLLPEDHGPGYVWRMLSETRIEQRDGGVYVEMETIALSRGIPAEFFWLIKPLAEHLPRNIMFQMLKDTRDAVRKETETASRKNQQMTQSAEHRD
jgi:hypothetical protein